MLIRMSCERIKPTTAAKTSRTTCQAGCRRWRAKAEELPADEIVVSGDEEGCHEAHCEVEEKLRQANRPVHERSGNCLHLPVEPG